MKNNTKLRESFERWIDTQDEFWNGHIDYQNKYYDKAVETAWQAYQAAHNAQQAEIDRLMFEFCPDDITPEQLKNWEDSQRRYEEPSMKYPPSDETI